MKKILYVALFFMNGLHGMVKWLPEDIAAIKKDHRDQINSIIKAVQDERALPMKFSQFQRIALIRTGNPKMDDHFYELGTWLGNLSYQRDALTLINETGKRMQELLTPLKKAIDDPTTAGATKITLKNLFNMIALLMIEYADNLKANGALEIQLAPIKISTIR